MNYSASTGGFYDPSLRADYEAHGHWPSDLVDITDDLYAEVSQNRPPDKIVVTGANGLPALADPADPTTDEQATSARAQRDALLAACDWTVLPDCPLTAAEQAAWKTYRQALRDITAQADFPTAIVWPDVPE